MRPTRRLLSPTTLLALALVAATNIGLWTWWNRPAEVPGWSGPVAGLAFSPFQRGQNPEEDRWPSADEIARDLAVAATVTDQIRTYAVHNGLERIAGLAQEYDLRVTLGSWLDRRLDHNRREIDRLIQIARTNRSVERVLVGNEVALRTDLTVPQLIAHIREVKRAVRQPVSTAEPWHVWLDHPELGREVDFITVHLLPYWEGLPIDDALRFTFEKLDAVGRAFPGKKIVVGEVGWPSDGRDIGGARATRVNQASFLRQFFAMANARGIDYFVMEAFDQPWKVPFEGRAAGYWGMFDLDRAPKWPMVGPVTERPGWQAWAGFSTLLAASLAAFFLIRRPDIRLGGKLMLATLGQMFVGVLTLVLMGMGSKYLSNSAAMVWGVLIAGQLLLLVLLLADSFEMAESVWGRVWKRRHEAVAAPEGTLLPKVSIHIPICNEPPQMVRQTLDALAALDYPDFEVLVIDNNTRDPALWEPVAEHCARLGGRFRFFHLPKWPGFKAGALNFAMGQTASDATVVGVIDSDYIVDPLWLRRMVPFFADAKVGFVQSPQDYRDVGESTFKDAMYWEYAGFFHVGMVQRNERNAIIQHGTMTLVRKDALANAGGWAEWCICEDAELGLKLFEAGWEAIYVKDSLGKGVMPDDFAAFRKQRFRWAYGAMQIVKRHAGALLNPFDKRLNAGQRWHFVTGWLPWIGDALGLVFLGFGLLWSIGLIVAPMRFEFPVELFMIPSLGLFGFKLFQIMLLYGAKVPCGWRERVGAAVAGLALTHTIAKAVIQGLFTSKAPFLRTPKMENAPALVQGLVMAREELIVLILTWAAMIGVGVAHGFYTLETKLWCAVLFTQSVPYLAAVTTSVVAALPGRRRSTVPATALGSAKTASAQGGGPANGSIVARTPER